MDLKPDLLDKINLAIEKKNPDKLLSLINENKIRYFPNDIILSACKSNNLEIMYLAINPHNGYYTSMDGDMIVPLKTSKNFTDIIVKLAQIAKRATYIDGFVREVLRHCEPRLIKTVFNIIGQRDHRHYLYFYDRNRINALTHRNDLNTFPIDLLPLIFGQLPQYIVEHLKYLTSEIRFPIKDMLLLNLFLRQYGRYYGTPRKYSYVINQILLPIMHKNLDYDALHNIDYLIIYIDDIILTIDHIIKVDKALLTSKCNELIKYYIGRYRKESVTFFLTMMKKYDLELLKQTKEFITKTHYMREHLILTSLSIEFYDECFYNNIDKDTFKNLKSMQKTQLEILDEILRKYITEKGIVKMISNYVGISEFLTQ